MKATAFFLVMLTAAAPAVSFDTGGFGERLNGWRKDRTTLYSLTDGVYRTYFPTITATPDRGMFLSTQIDCVVRGGGDAICHLELTFNAAGTVEGAQIKGLIEGKSLDTGLVRRAQPQPIAAPPAEGGAATSFSPLPGNPTNEMIAELFTRFDAEFKKVSNAEPTGKPKRDLFSRFGDAGTMRTLNVAAGLRHNLNLILQHVSA